MIAECCHFFALNSVHGEVEYGGAAAAGVDHRDRPGAGVVGGVERRVGELAGGDEGGALAGIGVVLRIVVGERGSAYEVAAVDG